jgi:tetratricopeptide (TPR) repeat protein
MRSPQSRKTFSLKRKFPSLILIICLLIALPFLSLQIIARIYLDQGDKLEREGKTESAIIAYQNSLKFQSNFAKTHLHLGKALQKQELYTEAFTAYNKALIINPDLAKQDEQILINLYNLAIALEKSGQINEAITIYQKLILIDPLLIKAHYNLAQAFVKQGQIDEAIAAFKAVIYLDANFVPAYLSLGKVFQEEKKWNEASKIYQKALNIDPINQEIYQNLGEIWKKQGQLKQAENIYLQAINLEPNNGELYNQLGEVLFQQQRVEEAIIAYQQALKLTSKQGEIYKNLCYARHSQRQFEAAILLCKQAYKIDPNQGSAKFYFQEMERALAIHKNPNLLKVQENIPSQKSDPLVAVKRAIVKVIISSSTYHSIGTGWLINRSGNQGLIITNRHVIIPPEQKQNSQAKIEVEFYSQPPSGQFRKRETATILHQTSEDEWLDLAILKVNNLPQDIQVLSLATAPILYNLPIKVIGHPINNKDWSVLSGEIYSATPQELLLSIMLASGSSGGPVLNEQNQVVGVVVKAGLYCSNSTITDSIELSLTPLGCGMAFPSEVVQQKLKSWGI